MKSGTVHCISCKKTFNVYTHKSEKQGAHITSVDSCSYHEYEKRSKNGKS